ncbi:CLAVATA3/ESR (CLE)-related protein 14 [Arabidopsis lyrata subsp. lyrata]|uniref:CLAVATA3/ESR (CLE)-related protein 14 n=1 Tax=Arabidopsis lyrata subsp. lyrata TaxID=81972 RepID=UPI000A29D8C9|nr:CLAVATA3/ESR (CLE)-related protein 14 [Arabidopsis lyrata subsp. lyrata]|eukprot:XP_020889824.1 CLAVATA3/ESR (CLE)-related protein 14 [Arabidopsis lyrata subsp. lyrata]
MKNWSQRLSLLIVMIFIFSGLHFSSASRKFPSMTTTEEFQRLSFDGKRMLSEVTAGEKYDRIYGASARLVPKGPNPLHNK